MANEGWVGRPLLVLNDEAITGSHRIAAARKAEIKIPVIDLGDKTGKKLNEWLNTNPENTWSVDLENFLRQGDEEKLHDLKRAKEDGIKNLDTAISLMEDEIRINNSDKENKTKSLSLLPELTNEDKKVTKAVNINDSGQDFTGQILRGEKTIETRDTINNALQPL